MYCHVSKNREESDGAENIRGRHRAFSVAEHEVAVEIVERVMQTAYMKRTHPRLRTRGSRERP